MIIYNGFLKESNFLLSIQNRGLKFGDSLFETMRVVNYKIKFWEDHYFRLMAGMRIMRMEIPMIFTMSFFQSQVEELCTQKGMRHARVRVTIFRKDGGLYAPQTHKVDFIIEALELFETRYKLNPKSYKVDLFKDFKKNKSLLSNVKSNNKLEHVIAAIYARENEWDNVLLINTDNHLASAINANIFMVNKNRISTPATTEGCVKGIIRKKIIEITEKNPAFDMIEKEVNSFELMKADEVFLTNVIMGVQSVTQFRKKHYSQTAIAEKLIKALNEMT